MPSLTFELYDIPHCFVNSLEVDFFFSRLLFFFDK